MVPPDRLVWVFVLQRPPGRTAESALLPVRRDAAQWFVHGPLWTRKILEDPLTFVLHCCPGTWCVPAGQSVHMD